MKTVVAGLCAIVLAAPSAGFAQSPPATTPSKDCVAAEKTAPTPSQTGPQSGTAPGNTGVTGWTNGLGGTHTDTTPSGPLPGAGTAHSPTARGLDPTKPGATPATNC